MKIIITKSIIILTGIGLAVLLTYITGTGLVGFPIGIFIGTLLIKGNWLIE